MQALNQRAPSETIRGAWYPLLILTLAYTCHFVDRAVISIVIEPIKAEFLLSDSQIGFASGLAYALAFSLAGIPIGMLIDRANRKNLLATIVAIWSFFTIIAGFANSYATLVLSRMCVGAAEAGGSPAALSIIGDLFSSRCRATAVSLYYLSVAFGTGASFIIGGVIAANYGWRAAFFVAGAPGLLLALTIFITLKEPQRGDVASATRSAYVPMRIGEAFRFARTQRALIHMTAGMIISNLIMSSFFVWIASYFIRTRGLDIGEAGLLVGISAGLFGAIGSAGGGALADRIARGRSTLLARIPAVTSACIVPVAILMLVAPDARFAAGAMMLLAIFLNAHYGPGYSLILSLAKPAMRGVSMSAVQVATNLISFGLGPLLVGVLSDFYGGRNSLSLALGTVFLMGFWASAHYLLASKTIAQDLLRSEA